MPSEPKKRRQEWMSVRDLSQRHGQRAEDKDEDEERKPEAHEPFAQEPCRATPRDRSRRQETRDKKEQPHEEGLVVGAEDRQKERGGRAARLDLRVEPGAARPIRDRGVVEDDEQNESCAKGVDPGVTGLSEA